MPTSLHRAEESLGDEQEHAQLQCVAKKEKENVLDERNAVTALQQNRVRAYLLASGELSTHVSHLSVVTIGKRFNKLVSICCFCSCLDVVDARIWFPVTNVCFYRSAK